MSEATLPQRRDSNLTSVTTVSLHRRESSLSSYQATCISKHYALNEQILLAFEEHLQSGLTKVAFYLGLKFVESALLEIPQHGYFYANKFAEWRLQSTVDALRTCHSLQTIIAKEPTDPSFTVECHKIERLHYLAMQQYDNLGEYDAIRQRVQAELDQAYHPLGDLGAAAAARPTRHQRMTSAGTMALKSARQHRSSQSNGAGGGGAGSFDASSISATFLACGDSLSSVFCPPSYATATASGFPGANHTSKDAPTVGNGSVDKNLAFPDSHTRQQSLTRFPLEGRQPEDPMSLRRDDESKGRFPEPSQLHGTRPSQGSLLDDDRSIPDLMRPLPRRPSNEEGAEHVAPLVQPARNGSFRRPRVERAPSEYSLQRALFLSGLEVQDVAHKSTLPPILPSPPSGELPEEPFTPQPLSSQEAPFAPPGAKKREEGMVSMEMLNTCYHEDFDQLRNDGRIVLRHVPTYQGRIPGSINGCTVIAPLMCIHHFHNENVIPDSGIPDQVIVEVIDEEAPTILPVVRKNLGVVKDAFLIPVDAHDALMEMQYMCQEQFVTVCGGNVMEPEHLEPMLKELSQLSPKKIAATFFFHEHVITITQLNRGGDKVWFDIIDSLPHEETLLRMGETVDESLASEGAIGVDSMRLTSEGTWLDSNGNINEGIDAVDRIPAPPNAVRIRCKDVDSLRATLLWYACSVFTVENQAYIDTYQWDEQLSDFDPRVFQAFVWTQA